MKRIFCIVLTICILLCGLTFTAEASQQFNCTASSSDGNAVMIYKGNNYTASLKFTLSSKSGRVSKKVVLESIYNTSTKKTVDLSNESFSNLSSYTTGVYDIAFLPIDAGKTVTLQLNWHYDNENGKYTEDIDVALGAPNPDIALETNIKELTPVPGATVKLKYTIINTGNVPLQYVTVTDEAVTSLANKSVVYQMSKNSEYFEAGKSVSVELSFKIEESIVSAPKITYAFDGEEYKKSITEAKLEVNDVVPEVSFWCDSYTVNAKGDEQTFKYNIKNGSNVKLQGCCIYSSDAEDATVICGPFDIDAGITLPGEFVQSITHTGFYKFKITYTYEGADGTKEIIAKTERGIKFPNEVYLSVAGVSPTSVSEACDVTFTLKVENKTSSDLRNITISEDSGLMSAVSLNVVVAAAVQNVPGELTRDVTVHIPADKTKLKFILSYTLDDELYTTNTSYDVNFDAPLTVPTPTAEATAEPAESDSGNGSSLLIGIIICLIILVVIAAAIIILIVIKRKGGNGAPSSVYRKMSDEEEYSDTDSDGQNEDNGDFYIDDSEPIEETDEPIDGDIDDDGVKIYRKKQ